MNKQHTLLFSFFAILFVLSTMMAPYPFSWLVKLLPMAILIFVSYQKVTIPAEKLFLTGLVFSAGGDFFLDYDRVNWFIYGLGSFLIAHLFYMMSLMPVVKKRLPAVILYMIYGAIMFSVIMPGLGKLFAPVLVYMMVLLLMGIFTLISSKSNPWFIIGGISFVVSDSLIGINKFYAAVPYSHILIMVTYYFAQYSLVNGMFYNKVKR